ncbi:bifunctional diguanylate cyclase/phosphodiesterase [Francisellaceae bacterium]|nr:bifunctional diguanylate cyclase/phosphodiesterase [Francisellaceae bacterium]
MNDRYGHHSGDVLLKLVVERLLTVFRKEDRLARIGGDEFAAIIENIHSIDEIRLVAQRCIKAVAKEFNVLGNTLTQYISVGVSIYPDSADKADKLLQCADTAMYRAKEKGKNNLAFFREELDQKMQRNSLIENALRQATVNNEFHLLYQPQYNAKQEIFGVEALLRWDNENIKNSNPDEFIPIAEKTREIIGIGLWVISQALSDMSVLNKKYPLLDIQLSVNISSVQLFNPGFIDHLLSLLSKNGFNPKHLTLEITETHLMEDIIRAKDALLELSKFGIKVALDDFGTGHSSLNYLANLPISYLKIDKGFVLNSDKNNNHIIMKSIIDLANNLEAGCIAEGVETVEQYKYLIKNGCDMFQGFYFSKPITVNNLCKLIKQNTK